MDRGLVKRLRMLRAWHAMRRFTELTGARFAQETLYQAIFDSALRALRVDAPPFYATKSGANYSLLYSLLRSVTETPAKRILEVGAGQTSLLLNTLKQIRPDLQITSLETDPDWRDWIANRVDHAVVHSSLSRQIIEGVEVKGFFDLSGLQGKTFDLVLVDGPPGAQKRNARWAVLPILRNHLAGEFLVIFDDAERSGEQDTIKQFARSCDNSVDHGLTVGTKGQIMLFTPAYRAAKYF